MKRIWVRRTGRATWVSTAIALMSFPLFLVALSFLLDWLSWKILDHDLITYCAVGFGIAEEAVIACLFIFIVILSWFASRLLFACMIFQRVLDETPRCDCCGYNLRGNRSGCCPECGMPFVGGEWDGLELGMSKDGVRLLLGEPHQVNQEEVSVEGEFWCYEPYGYVTFSNGKVSGWCKPNEKLATVYRPS